MPEVTVISVARDFSRYPGGRYVSDSAFSGEALRQLLTAALRASDRVVVDFDGVVACSSSFLEEAMGGLVRNAAAVGSPPEDIVARIEVRALDPSTVFEAELHMRRALGRSE